MSETHEVEIVIGADGVVQLLVRGIQGPSCIDLTRDLERYLGGRVVLREETEEQRPVRVEAAQRSRAE